ncbi:MAG: putative bacteriocin export ABC transporter [Erysipelotrichaceae bacterium]|nr:putative bacteriocin export ABC transporter [Erysipelotrichaceae bacterium]
MIEIKKVTKAYGNKVVLDKLSYTFEDGKMIGVYGESGCGKSTLLNILGLLDKEYEGEVIINGIATKKLKNKDIDKLVREQINYLFQNYALIDDMSVEENLMIVLKHQKLSKREKGERIKQVLEEVSILPLLKNKVYTLSGGEQQRVALARIMLKEGNIILADEPTGNLDVNNRDVVLSILKKLKQNGATVILVSHDHSLLEECDALVNL